MSASRITYCVDVGSVRAGNFGWARVNDGRWQVDEGTEAASELVERLREDAVGTASVSIGFESPLFIPLREDPLELARARAAWEHSSFAGGPGAGVLVTGLVQVAHVLRGIGRAVTTDPTVDGSDSIVVWEAFISGGATADMTSPRCPGGQHGPHACDALVAALEWHRWANGQALKDGAIRMASEFNLGRRGRGLDLVAAVTSGNGIVENPAAWRATILQLPKPSHH